MGFWRRLFGASKDYPLATEKPNAPAREHVEASKSVVESTTKPPLSQALTAQQWFERASAATDDDEKVGFYSEAIRLKPDYPEAFFRRGGARHAKGDLDGALEDFTEAIRLKPNFAEAFYLRGLTRRDSVLSGHARDVDVRGHLQGEPQDYDEAIRLKPDFPEALCSRGFVRLLQGEKEGALKDYNEAIRLKPDDAEAFLDRALVRRSGGDKEGALQDYSDAIHLKPDYAKAFFNRGGTRRETGDREGALADYNEAIRLTPDYPEALSDRGGIRREIGDLDGALQDLTEAIHLKPDAEVLLHRSFVLGQKGEWEGMLHDCNEAIRLKPGYAEAFYVRGGARYENGDLNGALQDFTEVVRLKPDFSEAFYFRGRVRQSGGDTEGALQDYSEAIRLKPDFADAFRKRGDTRRDHTGDLNGAIQDYTEAIRLTPSIAGNFIARANARRAKGDEEGAMRDENEAMRLGYRGPHEKTSISRGIPEQHSSSPMISDKLAARTPAVTECSTPPEYHKIVGIDLGTNFSVIAAWNNVTAGAEAFDVPGHQPPTCSLPSVVSLNRQGKTLVGWQAKRNLAANPGNTIMEVKRLMGDPQELDLGGRKFSPQMISAMVLEQLKAIAETRMGSPIHDAVIAVPAHFTNVQRQATSDAARLAGLNPRLLINEPTAVAFAFGLDHLNDEEETYVVYDLGGSTFDASVIVARDKGIEVIASASDDRLGGDEFDNVIGQWVLEHLEQEWPGVSVLVHQHKDLWARLKAAAEQAKIDLSTSDTATIDVPNLTPKIDVLYEINRDTFIRLLDIPRARRPGLAPVGLLGFTILAVEEAVARAGARLAGEFGRASFGVEDVAAFVLVGGSVRIPGIREMLAERFGRPVLFDSATADTAVAVGAAIVARLMTPMGRFEG